jgi:hypothetical protein
MAHKYFVITFDKIYFLLEDLVKYGQLRYNKCLKHQQLALNHL